MLFGNPFSGAPNPGVPGNTATPQPPAPPGSVQDTRSDKINSGIVPDNKQMPELDPATGKPKVKKDGDELGVDFGKLWDNEEVDPNKQSPQDEAYLPKIDPAKLQETIGKVDFSKGIKPEQLTAIATGGEGAAAALAQIVNQVGQQSLLTAFTAANKMIESGLKNAEGRFLGKVDPRITDLLSANNLFASNPAAKDPKFAPMVEGVRKQIQQKYPKFNPGQVEAAVNKYFEDFVSKGTKKAPVKTEDELEIDNTNMLKKGAPGADWEKWFESGDASQKRQ